jgi:hypothetical protein
MSPNGYLEVQIHGGMTVDGIEYVEVRHDIISERENSAMVMQTQPAQIGPDMNPDARLDEVLARFLCVHLIADNGLSLFRLIPADLLTPLPS